MLRALRVVHPWVKEIPPSVYFPSSSPEIEPYRQIYMKGSGGVPALGS